MRAVAVFVLVLIGCAHGAAHRGSAGAWVELETENFVLQTDLPGNDAREVAQKLEEVRGAMIAGSWHGNRLRAEKIRVVELADQAEMREFTPRGISGFFIEEAMFGEPLMVMSAEQSPSQQPILKHELAHQLQSSFLLRSKPWLQEGLACYVQTLRYHHAEERYVFGEPDQERLFYLHDHPETDLGRVLTATPEEVAELGAEEAYAFQTASWLVVFYLANERRPQLEDYLQRLAKAEDPRTAFDASFGGLSVDQLWRELSTYQRNVVFQQTGLGQRSADYTAVKLDVPKWSGSIESKSLGSADVAAIRGELFLYSFADQDRSERVARATAAAGEALAVDPTHPVALAVRFVSGADRTPEAADQVRAATRARLHDARVWLLLGKVLPDSDFLERKAALEKAVALAPSDVATLDALTWDHLRGGRGPEALRVALRASTLAAGRASTLDALGTALAMSGRCADAVKVEERAVELLTENASPRSRSAAAERLQAFRKGCRDIPMK
jgi:tetratricopeptide (TPR) repeat protein